MTKYESILLQLLDKTGWYFINSLPTWVLCILHYVLVLAEEIVKVGGSLQASLSSMLLDGSLQEVVSILSKALYGEPMVWLMDKYVFNTMYVYSQSITIIMLWLNKIVVEALVLSKFTSNINMHLPPRGLRHFHSIQL